MYKIYIYKNDINNKVYVGQTSKTLEERARNGLGYVGCTHFYHAIQKYGWNKFHGAILEDGLTAEQANIREEFWINYFNARDYRYGYNIREGGDSLEGMHRGKAKKVFCIEEQKWFNSLADAAEWAGIGRKGGLNLGQAAKGTRTTAGEHPITHEALHWSFQEQPRDSVTKVQTTKAKRVQDLTTGVIYSSMKEAMKKSHISQGALVKSCTQHVPAGREKHLWQYLN